MCHYQNTKFKKNKKLKKLNKMFYFFFFFFCNSLGVFYSESHRYIKPNSGNIHTESFFSPFFLTIIKNIVKNKSPIHKKSHLSQVNDEAVSLVEAGPGHVHLGGPDHPATLNVEQPLHVHVIGDNMLESRGHAPFLSQKNNS